MINLVLDVFAAPKHAQVLMRELGITYLVAVPQSMGDCWWFFGCECVPEQMPDYISVRDFGDLSRLVGYGLSQIEVDALNGVSK